jgi:hypothetical protein
MVMRNSNLGKFLWSFFRQKREYYIKSGINAVSVNKDVIQHYLDNYWLKIFPAHKISNKLHLKDNKIHIFATLPPYSELSQKILIEKIEKDLASLFNEILGYDQEFYLSVSFKQ